MDPKISTWNQLSAEVINDPAEWPDGDFLIVERREATRRGGPWCFLLAKSGRVLPIVYMSLVHPTDSDFDLSSVKRFEYENNLDLITNGWTPYEVVPAAEP